MSKARPPLTRCARPSARGVPNNGEHRVTFETFGGAAAGSEARS